MRSASEGEVTGRGIDEKNETISRVGILRKKKAAAARDDSRLSINREG